jgi:ABC-type lipoprotein release transport system permease subunit
MKHSAVFLLFFAASWVLGAAPIVVGVLLVYAATWLFSRAAPSTPPPPPPPSFGAGSRKLHR